MGLSVVVVDLALVIECLWCWSVFSVELNVFGCGDGVSFEVVKVEVDCLWCYFAPSVVCLA